MGHGHFLNSTGRHEHFLNSTGRHWAFLKSTRKIRTPRQGPLLSMVNNGINEVLHPGNNAILYLFLDQVMCLAKAVRNNVNHEEEK